MIPEINLLPRKEKKTLSGRMYIIVSMSVFLLTALFLTYAYIDSKNARSLADVELLQLQADIIVLQSEIDNKDSQVGSSRYSAVDFTEKYTYSVSPIVTEITAYLPTHSFLRDYSFLVNTVSFKVDFEDKTMITLFVEDLLMSKMFTDVKLDEIISFELDSQDGSEESIDFDEVPRYSGSFTVDVDIPYLRSKEVAK